MINCKVVKELWPFGVKQDNKGQVATVRWLQSWCFEDSGHEIAPNKVANATKIIVLATKIQTLVAKLATRTLWVLYILPWCILQLNEALK